MKSYIRAGFSLFALAGISLFAGCNGTTTNPVLIPTTSPSHLYVADGATTGALIQYALPLTSTSTPTALISSVQRNIGAAANASVVVAQATGGATRVLTQPVTSSSTVTASFSASNTFPALGPTGLLFSSIGSTAVQVYTPPFTNASVPSSTFTTPIGVSSVAVDPSGNIYVNNGATGIAALSGTGTLTANITVASRFYRGMIASATQLFACNVAGATGTVDVFTLPLSNASVPAFSITTGVNGPEGCALDSSGSLYVSNINNGTVTIYAAPFSAASSPTLTFTLPGTVAAFGIAIGP
jgi:hypothetical protein